MLLDAVVSAENRAVVHEERLHAVPRGGDGRTKPSGPSTYDHNIVFAAVGDCRVGSRKPPSLGLQPLAAVRRNIAEVGSEQHRVASGESSGEIDKRNLRLASRKREIASLLPTPARLLRNAEVAAALAADLKSELSRGELRQPVLGANPRPPSAGRRYRDLGLRRGKRLQHALGDEVRAPHLVDELRVDLPAAIVGELLRLKPQEALDRLAALLRRGAEFLQRLGWILPRRGKRQQKRGAQETSTQLHRRSIIVPGSPSTRPTIANQPMFQFSEDGSNVQDETIGIVVLGSVCFPQRVHLPLAVPSWR